MARKKSKNEPEVISPLTLLREAIARQDWQMACRSYHLLTGESISPPVHEQGNPPAVSGKQRGRPRKPKSGQTTPPVAPQPVPSPAREDEVEKYRITPRPRPQRQEASRDDGRRVMRKDSTPHRFSNRFDVNESVTGEKETTAWINQHVKPTKRRPPKEHLTYDATCSRCQKTFVSDTPPSQGEINLAVCLNCIRGTVRER